MAAEPKNEPAKKLRRLLNGSKTPVVTKLPKKDATGISDLPQKVDEKKPLTVSGSSPKEKLLASLPKAASSFKNINLTSLGPPFWTIASAISLTVNVVLLIILLSVLSGLN